MNRFFKFVISCLILCLLTPSLSAQRWKLRRYEVGGGIGMTQIFGDIGGTASTENWFGLKDIQFDETSLAFGANLRYKLSPVYSLKLNTILAFGNGEDAGSRNEHRGFSYKTTLFEFSVQGEYYFISEEKRSKSMAMFNRRGMVNNYSTFSSYLFLGLGGVYNSTNTSYDPEYVNNRGAIDAFSPGGVSVAVPVGLGLKYIISDKWLINAELGYRWTSSDFLDGYTQIVSSKHNDIYYFLMLNVGYRIKTSRKGLPVFLDRGYKRSVGSGGKALF